MCAVFTSLGTATACMLLASLLVTGVGGVTSMSDLVVTTQECRNRGRSERVRQYPEDRDALELWLISCSLDEINEGDLTGLPNITTIYLHINAIAHVDLAVFRNAPKLESLDLSNNKLRELPAFPEHSCPRLTGLALEYNQLTTLHDAGTFSACTRLQILLLSNNLITSIHPEVFSSLTELRKLDLYNNKLSFIPDHMLGNNIKLRNLFLHNNSLTYLPQEFASSFKRAGGGLDVFHFYDNPWRCACLLELLADVHRAGVRDYEYYWHKYEGTRPECVHNDTAPFAAPGGCSPRSRPAPRREGGASNR